MGPETKFTILLYQYCKWNARRTHPKEGLRAFAFLISVYKTAGLGCTLGHQIMSCILPLGRGIIHLPFYSPLGEDAAIDQAAFIIKLLDCQNDRVPHMEIRV